MESVSLGAQPRGESDMILTGQAAAAGLANLIAARKRERVKLHCLNPVPINELAERWIGKFDQTRLRSLAD